MSQLTKEERETVIRHAKSLLLEHCSSLIIVAEFLVENPSQSPPVGVGRYGSTQQMLGLLSYATEKEKNELWTEFNRPDDNEEDSTV